MEISDTNSGASGTKVALNSGDEVVVSITIGVIAVMLESARVKGDDSNEATVEPVEESVGVSENCRFPFNPPRVSVVIVPVVAIERWVYTAVFNCFSSQILSSFKIEAYKYCC